MLPIAYIEPKASLRVCMPTPAKEMLRGNRGVPLRMHPLRGHEGSVMSRGEWAFAMAVASNLLVIPRASSQKRVASVIGDLTLRCCNLF